MMPPMPAMAAERANRASFTRSGETPEVDAAISDDRTAAMLRPHGERLRLLISSITSQDDDEQADGHRPVVGKIDAGRSWAGGWSSPSGCC